MRNKLVLVLASVLLVFTACKKEFTITVQSNNELWGSVSGGGTFAKGTEIEIKASPKVGYKFVSWQDNNTDNPRIIMVESDVTYTAIFASEGSDSDEPGGLVINTGIACIDALANDMVKVQGGTFVMGSADDDTDAYNDEKPQHSVTLSDFYICKYEVTQELWEAVMGSTPTANGGWTDKYGKGDKYPAYYISWNDCDTFLQKLNTKTGLKFRFPTEAEWEYAARGGNKADTTKYAGSNMIDVVAWHNGNSGNIAHTCGTKRANALGIYDMTGNVWEWCSDWYSSTYYNESANSTDPKGPPSRTKCVSRGGSWHNDARFCRVAYRYCCTPSARYSNQGFRVVLQ